MGEIRMKWLFRLRHGLPWRHRSGHDDDFLIRVLSRDADRLRSLDPETHLQWLRLQRSMAEPRSVRLPAVRRRIPRWAIALGLGAAVIVGVYVIFLPDGRPKPEMFITERGQQARVVLQDDSEALLNAATRLEVASLQPGKPRRVSLEGEAFFRVRASGTPFVISTRSADVEVVGTEFNVRARGHTLEVAVMRGIVNVSAQESTVTLTQHQMALCSEGEAPRFAGTVPSAEYPGWMSGKLFLRQTPLEAACRELELRFDISIRVNDPAVRGATINGVLDARDPQAALASLSGLIRKTFRYDGKTYVID